LNPQELIAMTSIQVFLDTSAQTKAAIDLFITSARSAIEERGVFSVALSGGNTPKKLYAGLAEPDRQVEVDWANIHLFFGDERHVPPDHPDSNFLMVQNTLCDKVSIPIENVHRVKTEMEPRMAAFNYEDDLRAFFSDEWPHFDLVLLGMGDDGHTASLFPGTVGLNEEQRWFIANPVPSQGGWRLTLTKHAINAARMVVVLVSGGSKAEMLHEVMAGTYDPLNKPIQLISPSAGEMIWLLDRAAASLLPDVYTPPTFNDMAA
jgi:6-phosphogluconolactonase